MKQVKKILALVLVTVMMMAMAITASAATITVENAVKGETYSAYKLLEYTNSGVAYSYYLETSNSKTAALKALLEGCTPAFSFTQSADGTRYFVNNSAALAGKGAEIAEYLYEHMDAVKTNALESSTDKIADADGKVAFDELAQGYWFVTSSLGSLCTLQSYDAEEIVVEKNSMITDEKEVDASSENAQVGDTLTYTITLTDGKGTNLEATVTDTMSKGLTYNNDATVTANGSVLTKGTDFTVSTSTDASGNTVIVYTITAAVMEALKEGEEIVITYTATVNSDASLDGTEVNTEYTEYSEQKTGGNTVDVSFENLTINKTDGTNALKGAQFALFRTDSTLTPALDHVAVTLRALTDEELTAASITKAADTVYYTVDAASTNTTIDMTEASSAVVYGLDKDSTYYLQETKAPDGYNLLAEEKEVDLGSTTTVDVVNNAGSVLPSTGGIGTTIFYVVGGLLVAAAIVVLITKRRMAGED